MMNTIDQKDGNTTRTTGVSRRSLLIAGFSASIISLPGCDDSDSFHPGKIVQISKSINPSDIHVGDPAKNIKIIEDAQLDKALQRVHIGLMGPLHGKKIVNLDGTWFVILQAKDGVGKEIPLYKIYQDSTKDTIKIGGKNTREGVYFEYNSKTSTIENLGIDAIAKAELNKIVREIEELL